jgi:hypothetical protein
MTWLKFCKSRQGVKGEAFVYRIFGHLSKDTVGELRRGQTPSMANNDVGALALAQR